MLSQRVGNDWATELYWTELKASKNDCYIDVVYYELRCNACERLLKNTWKGTSSSTEFETFGIGEVSLFYLLFFFFTDDEFNSSINTGDSYLEWNLRALIPECKYHHLSFEIYMKIVNFICVLILQDVTPFINGV